MEYRKYVCPSLQEAIQRIERDLGPDASIVYSNRIKVGGFLGFFTRSMYEVVAAKIPFTAISSDEVAGGPLPSSLTFCEDPLESYRPVALAPPSPPEPLTVPMSAPAPGGELTELRREIDDLRKAIGSLAENVRSVPGPVAAALPLPLPPPPPPILSQMAEARHASPEPKKFGESRASIREIMGCLEKMEISPELSERILKHIEENVPTEDLGNCALLREKVVDFLSGSMLNRCGIDVAEGAKPRVVAMVGPTGVGKTTSLAKLGAGLKFNRNLNVGFITLDTFRIAAPEQLKKYAEILEVPVEVVFDPARLPETIHAMADRDVILIDTAGRSPRNRQDMKELASFLEFGLPVETYLVLSATTKFRDLVDTMERFAEVKYSKLIFTKLDETETLGSMISILSTLKKACTYVTMGQNVPDDILPADPSALAKLLFEREAQGRGDSYMAAAVGAT